MKHLIKSDGFRRAWCTRPGCMTSLEGPIVDFSELNKFFGDDCPFVWIKDDRTPNFEKRVKYLLNKAKEEILAWQKLIKYWEEKKYEDDKV